MIITGLHFQFAKIYLDKEGIHIWTILIQKTEGGIHIMKLFVRGPEQTNYRRQLNSYPFISISSIKPGDTLYGLNADYHVDRVEYSKSDLIVYATKTQIQERMH